MSENTQPLIDAEKDEIDEFLNGAKQEHERLNAKLDAAKGPIEVAMVLGEIFLFGLSHLPIIAAELKEINLRDTAAEVRTAELEQFVESLQQALQQAQTSGLVTPVGGQLIQRS